MILSAPDMFYDYLMTDADLSRMILRDKANNNQPEIKSWLRRIIALVRGRG